MVQIVFQDPYNSLNPRMSVEEIVGEGLCVHFPELSSQEKYDKIVNILCEVGLDESMMKKYAVEFFKRGLIFGGFGPIIMGFIYLCIENSTEGFSLSGGEVFLAIVSIYILAFLQAGASVFNQIEEWSLGKSLFWHFLTIYLAYVGCYLINSWIPFEPMFLVVFTETSFFQVSLF